MNSVWSLIHVSLPNTELGPPGPLEFMDTNSEYHAVLGDLKFKEALYNTRCQVST